VIPSFASTLLEGGVSPEEEYLIMCASVYIYLGMFGSWPYFSCLDCFFAGALDMVHTHPGNQVCTDQPHLQIVSAIHACFLAMILFPEVQAKA
jgi:hypothetical protein